ncbi:hypothetical protein CPB83DRAFT_67169 [Crepidotus variabilis]|uniref:Uncharacterized protein n=1 Tax=Crepidotus variabilis TaxID=179855 RepID=A0A9P6E5P6_9AGAR|nr:hypothetical protein CPB83DRAFT_67169 [Crepidotus variabilis]
MAKNVNNSLARTHSRNSGLIILKLVLNISPSLKLNGNSKVQYVLRTNEWHILYVPVGMAESNARHHIHFPGFVHASPEEPSCRCLHALAVLNRGRLACCIGAKSMPPVPRPFGLPEKKKLPPIVVSLSEIISEFPIKTKHQRALRLQTRKRSLPFFNRSKSATVTAPLVY